MALRKEIKYIGVVRANPAEYLQRFGSSVTSSSQLPQFVNDIKTPDGIVLAADYKYNEWPELEGDLRALTLIDLDREGLGAYRSYLQLADGDAAATTSSVVEVFNQQTSATAYGNAGSYGSAGSYGNAGGSSAFTRTASGVGSGGASTGPGGVSIISQYSEQIKFVQ